MASVVLHPNDTVVISDFDGTVIHKVVSGKKVPSLMASVMDEAHLGLQVFKEYHRLFDLYYPYEQNPQLSATEKSIHMNDWWTKIYELFAQIHLPESIIHEACESPLIKFRPQLSQFYKFLYHQKVPLIIYSASGIGFNAISYLLDKYRLNYPNLKIVSNHLVFDKQHRFSHVLPPIIHSANKTGSFLVKNGILKSKLNRKQCLVLGDSLDDVRMVEGLHFNQTLKVAFADPHTAGFKQLFDLILPLNSGYQPILDLFLS